MEQGTQPYSRKHMIEVLDSILVIWNKNPYLRLGQLLVNATGINDLFYIEDHEVVNKVMDWNPSERHVVERYTQTAQNRPTERS